MASRSQLANGEDLSSGSQYSAARGALRVSSEVQYHHRGVYFIASTNRLVLGQEAILAGIVPISVVHCTSK